MAQARNNPTNLLLQLQLPQQYKPRRPHVVGSEYTEAKRMLKQYQEECVPEKFGISKNELEFFLQNLLSKGLLRDDRVSYADNQS
ncbi:MAG: hypothetical protein Q8941_23490 [Bacteroidota bacterium]|nr:hypothetical protein [Bacteroidota bacterium]